MIIPEFMYDVFEKATEETKLFGHGFTYSGHPVAAAVAVRNLELMEEMGRVRSRTRYDSDLSATLA